MLLCVCSVMIDHRWRQNVVKMMFLPHFNIFCDLLLNRCTATWNLFVSNNKETNYHWKTLRYDTKSGLCPAIRHLGQTRKKVIWRNLLSIQMKQSHWLLWVAEEFLLLQENYATVKLESIVASHGMKTYSESRTELRNLQNVNKMLTVLSSEQPCELKSLDVALNITGVKKYARKNCGCGQHWRSFNPSFEWKER